MAITRSQNVGSLSTKSAIRSQPALFTRTSSGPRPSSTARTAACTATRSLTSASAATARPPAIAISFATARAVVPSRSTMPIATPVRARRCAMARPMPRPPPVTSATAGNASLLPRRQRGRERPAHRDLAGLAERDELPVDAMLPRLVVLPRHAALAGDRIAGPHARREPDLVPTEVLRSDEVGDALRDEPGRQHAVAEDGRIAGHLREFLVVVDRVEVTRRARVANQVRAREAVDHEWRDRLPFLHLVERHPCTAPSVSMTVFREYAT